MAGHFVDLSGMVFGSLTVIERVPKPEHLRTRGTYYKCKCECGRETVVISWSLVSGTTKSCGQHSPRKVTGWCMPCGRERERYSEFDYMLINAIPHCYTKEERLSVFRLYCSQSACSEKELIEKIKLGYCIYRIGGELFLAHRYEYESAVARERNMRGVQIDADTFKALILLKRLRNKIDKRKYPDSYLQNYVRDCY